MCVRVCVLVYRTGIVWNGLICGYANILHTSSSFHAYTHIHTQNTHILMPFEDHELMGLKLKVNTGKENGDGGGSNEIKQCSFLPVMIGCHLR